MRFTFFSALLFLFNLLQGQQNVLELNREDLTEEGYVIISDKSYWNFYSGNDTLLAPPEMGTNDGLPINPIQISQELADANRKIEGWFSIKLKLDQHLTEQIDLIYLSNCGSAITIYVNDSFIKYFDEKTNHLRSPIPFEFSPGEVYTITVHYVNQVSNQVAFALMNPPEFGFELALANRTFLQSRKNLSDKAKTALNVTTIISSILSVLLLLIFMQNRRLKSLKLIAITSSLFTSILWVSMLGASDNISFIDFGLLSLLQRSLGLIFSLALYYMILVFAHVFTGKAPRNHAFIILLIGIAVVSFTVIQEFILIMGLLAIIIGICISYMLKAWKKASLSQWAIIVGFLFTILFIIGLLTSFGTWYGSFFVSLTYLSFPVSSLFFISFRFKEMIAEVESNAEKVIALTEEQRIQSLKQQDLLEQEVEERTKELKTSLENLKATQDQLIHSEKMASLGELTAGIAHEIQNPLNFVNNFSELNKELLDDLKAAVAKNNQQEVLEIIKALAQNEGKITQHGKRAEEIVKSMLQHSRASTGEKELTDINALADEYLRLAYHGLRAKDKSFNATFKAELDPHLPQIKVVPQEIGRVLLNLINNAFQAVKDVEKPEVVVKTSFIQSEGDTIVITISDNGPGIPSEIRDKIFQPFFTTKPTGQGTGLGLSMSYDIVTKGHRGALELSNEEEKGATFIMSLPLS